MLNQNIISNKFDLNVSTIISYTMFWNKENKVLFYLWYHKNYFKIIEGSSENIAIDSPNI